jgi:hypothetical protein
MAFTPRLPTFNSLVDVYKYRPATADWELQDDQLGCQVYTQLRTQDEDGGGTLYLEYDQEDDVLRDKFDYNNDGNADVVIVYFPTANPREVGYRVRDVQPRWLMFPNEHIMATLERLTPAEMDDVREPPVPPGALYQERQYDFEDSGEVGTPPQSEWFPNVDGTFSQSHIGLGGPESELLAMHPLSDFTLPTTATVLGISIRLGKTYTASSPNTVQDSFLRLQTLVDQTNNVASATPWPGPGGPQPVVNYGAHNDMMGLTATAAEVNSFLGLFFQCIGTTLDGDVVAYLGGVIVRVYYMP